MLVFRKPDETDISEIEACKQEFQAANSSMDGASILCNSSAAEWLRFNREMENCKTPNYVNSLQYGLFDEESGRLLGFL